MTAMSSTGGTRRPESPTRRPVRRPILTRTRSTAVPRARTTRSRPVRRRRSTPRRRRWCPPSSARPTAVRTAPAPTTYRRPIACRRGTPRRRPSRGSCAAPSAAPPDAEDGFAPQPGTRIDPSTGQDESPWWKTDAQRDPWRDPAAPFWLGRGAIYAAGQPAQLDPAEDVEHDDDEPPSDEDEGEKVVPIASGRPRFGLNAIGLSIVIALLAGALGGFGGYWLAGRVPRRAAPHRRGARADRTARPTVRPARSPTSPSGSARPSSPSRSPAPTRPHPASGPAS